MTLDFRPILLALVRSELPHIDPVLCFGGCPNFCPAAHSWDTARRPCPSQISSGRPRSRDEAVSEVKVDLSVKLRCRFPQSDAQAGASRATGLATLTFSSTRQPVPDRTSRRIRTRKSAFERERRGPMGCAIGVSQQHAAGPFGSGSRQRLVCGRYPTSA